MHDAVLADLAGVPAAAVMTSAFVDGAQLMGAVLGVPDVAFAVIQHPIASAGAEGLAERARVAVSEAVAIWTGESGTG